jgi:hypothetical protein
LCGEKEARRKVLPRPVENITREEQECDTLIDAQCNEIFHGTPCRRAEAFERCSLVPRKTAHRTVDVQIRGVNELHGRRILPSIFDEREKGS